MMTIEEIKVLDELRASIKKLTDRYESTIEDLKQQIRDIKSMEDVRSLQYEVGPTEEESQKQRDRIAAIDAMGDSCKWSESYVDHTTELKRERWNRIMEECRIFENKYC